MNKDIKYGNVEVNESDFSKENTKIRVTTMLDKDVLLSLKEEAKILGLGYQTLLNYKLREILFGEERTQIRSIEDFNKKLLNLENRLNKLEKKKA